MASLGTLLIIGSGYLGRHCAFEAQKEQGSSAAIHCVNRGLPLKKVPGVTYHEADITNLDAMFEVFQQVLPRVVIHTVSPKAHVLAGDVYDRVNVKGTQNIISAAITCNTVKVLIYTSSATVIWDGRSPLSEATEELPMITPSKHCDPYIASKVIAETLVLSSNRSGPQNMLTLALRPMAIFGPYDDTVISGMIDQARKGQANVQIGNGNNKMDWTFIENVASAHIHAARTLIIQHNSPGITSVDGQAFNITNDDSRSFWGFSRQVAAAVGHPVVDKDIQVMPRVMATIVGVVSDWYTWIVSLGARRSTVGPIQMALTVTNITFSMEKARNKLGWAPICTIDDAIIKSVQPYC